MTEYHYFGGGAGVSSGMKELAYAESTLTDFATASTTAVDVTGLVIAPEVRSRPIIIEAWTHLVFISDPTGYVIVEILNEADVVISRGYGYGHEANAFSNPILLRRRLALAAGTHEFRVTLRSVAPGTSHLFSDTVVPSYIAAYEI